MTTGTNLKFALYGIRKNSKKMLATFESEKQVIEYVENSLLYNACDPCYSADVNNGKYRYKKDSLLREWDSCEIGVIP